MVRGAIARGFDKARGISVGTVLATRGSVVPWEAGHDVSCGMRLHTTTLRPGDMAGRAASPEPSAARGQ